jgi:hypothetical protein
MLIKNYFILCYSLMASNSDIARLVVSRVTDTFNFVNIPYHHVKVYKDDSIIDITNKIKLNSILHPKLVKSPFLNDTLSYQFHDKDTNKYYIVETSLCDIVANVTDFPREGIQMPRQLFAPTYDVYINGQLLDIEDKIYYKNHHKTNKLSDVFMFNNIVLNSIIVSCNDIIVHKSYENFDIMTMSDICKYML